MRTTAALTVLLLVAVPALVAAGPSTLLVGVGTPVDASVAPSIEAPSQDSAKVESAVPAATAWIGLLDAGKVAESWQEASSLFRQAVTKDRWVAAAGMARSPYEPLGDRTLVSAEYTTAVPNAPPGEYVMIQFKTRTGDGAVVETAVVMLDGKEWKVAGYYIRPADQ